MGRKIGFLKIEIIIVALNFLLVGALPKEGMKVIYSIILGVAIIFLLFLKTKIEDERKEMWINIIAVFMAISSYFIIPNNSSVYFYLAVIDAMHMKNRKYKNTSIIFPIVGYVIAITSSSLIVENLNYIATIKDTATILSPYILFVGIVAIFHIRGEDKITIRKLNAELMEQNKKLREYSEQVETLTLEKERNRVAQELHDSLGHYLMAISMHLNMLGKIKDEEKKKEVFDKTTELVKESISELRETVYELKREGKETLKEKINRLEENFKEEINFENNIDEEIEKESLDIKEALYKTIKEGITNGLKHGNSKKFKIDINVEKEKILFNIQNNGLSPNEIKMSNGLKGIKERIEKINGNVYFEIKEGFAIRGEIKRRKND